MCVFQSIYDIWADCGLPGRHLAKLCIKEFWNTHHLFPKKLCYFAISSCSHEPWKWFVVCAVFHVTCFSEFQNLLCFWNSFCLLNCVSVSHSTIWETDHNCSPLLFQPRLHHTGWSWVYLCLRLRFSVRVPITLWVCFINLDLIMVPFCFELCKRYFGSLLFITVFQ